MIDKFVKRFDANRETLLAQFAEKHPDSYDDIVKRVVTAVSDPETWNDIDPERITSINYGSNEGTLVYVIGAKGYTPTTHYTVQVNYGSCPGCDTLERIRDYSSSDTPTDEQASEYFTLALHILQGLREIE